MKMPARITDRFSFMKRYRYMLVMYIAFIWPIVDLIIMVTRNNPSYYNTPQAIALRSCLVFFLSLGMGYILIFKLKRLLKSYPIALSLFVRSMVLIVAAFLMNFLLET